MHEKEGGSLLKNSFRLQGDSRHQRHKTIGIVMAAVIPVLRRLRQEDCQGKDRLASVPNKQTTMKKKRSIWSSWKLRIEELK